MQNNKKNTQKLLNITLHLIFVLITIQKAMNYIDYIIIILVIISAVKGATKGFIYELASLVALVGGIWGAIKFSYATKTYLVERLGMTNSHINIIAFVITFVIIIILVHLLAKAIEKALKSVSLGAANRILGFVFSAFKAVFILGILVILIEKIDESLPFIPEEDVQESALYNPIRTVTVSTFPLIQRLFDNTKDKFDDDSDDSNDSKNEEQGSTI